MDGSGRGILPGIQMSCSLDLPLGPSMRDGGLEADLQARIEDGHKVWAVGDIHGHLATFRALVHRLNLSSEDRIICLGDMIDRGPDSAGLIEFIRSDERIICLKGNHEQMAIRCAQEKGQIELWKPWLERGGNSTWGSYIVRAKGDLWEAKARFWDDLMWMDQLPNHIVLDDVRLVHAGYDPRMPPDAQGDKEMLWIRKRFYEHHSPIDPNRTILFGHSTTTKVGPCPGQVAASNMTLDDGRPAWIAMDVGAFNHVSPGIAAINIDTLRVVKQTTLRSERWFDLPTRRESTVGEHWGLSVLKTERRKEMTKQLRKRRQLRMAGVVLQSEEAIMATANEPRHIQKIVAKMDWNEQFGPTQRTLQLEKTTSVKMQDDSSLEHLKPGDYTDGFYSDRVEICSEEWTPRGGNRIVYGPGHSQEERQYGIQGPDHFKVYARRFDGTEIIKSQKRREISQ